MARPPAKAQAIADQLAEEIVAGHIPPGAWLPPERELADRFGAVRSTVRRATEILTERGLASREGNQGVKVRSGPARRDVFDITRREGQWRGIHLSMARTGGVPFVETVVREVPADTVVARWLGVPALTPVLERARRHGIEGQPPKQLSTTWFTPEVADKLPILRQVDTGAGGYHSRMEEIGYQLSFEDAVTCRRPTAEECQRLDLAPDDPVMNVWRRCYDQTDRVVEVTFRVIPGDRQELLYRYQDRG
jgi:GntR family transcriptional regulator